VYQAHRDRIVGVVYFEEKPPNDITDWDEALMDKAVGHRHLALNSVK